VFSDVHGLQVKLKDKKPENVSEKTWEWFLDRFEFSKEGYLEGLPVDQRIDPFDKDKHPPSLSEHPGVVGLTKLGSKRVILDMDFLDKVGDYGGDNRVGVYDWEEPTDDIVWLGAQVAWLDFLRCLERA
jgi:hypothetical protein